MRLCKQSEESKGLSTSISESQRVRINGDTLIMQIAHRCVVYSFPVAIVKKRKEKKGRERKKERKREGRKNHFQMLG